MYRTLVITGHTFREAIVQPIFALLLALAGVTLAIFSLLPFFTLGEDTLMFKSVALDVILLFVLLSTLFAASKSVYEEIEDRTMLTLMSKPVKKWEVMLGKYLGIAAAAGVGVALLGLVSTIGVWWRVPGDYLLSPNSLDRVVLDRIAALRWMHLAGLFPSLVLVWFQVCVLAAIGVALSVRFSLVVNLPTVILLYMAGNLTRFLFPVEPGATARNTLAQIAASFLPYLQTFDLRHTTIYREIRVPGTEFASALLHPHAVSMSSIWGYVGVAGVYAIGYAIFALALGLILFQSRELGGAEG